MAVYKPTEKVEEHTKSMRLGLAFLILLLHAFAFSQTSIDTKLAARWFQEAEWASSDDGGKLWGHKLYGPIIFVDPQTRNAVANQPDKEGRLKPVDGVWVGTVPADLTVANTAADWAGVHWTMVMLDLPDATARRTLLVMHECWHRIQEEIGLPPARPDNSHLDSKDGRIWLKLEFRALSLALMSWGEERKQAISDALAFRAYRRSLFPKAALNEDRMEVHEGMAEYTGVKLMGLGDWGTRSYISGRIKVNALKPSYPFSFAYETGPAYGLLLDVDEVAWRAGLTPKSSLSESLQRAEKLTLPANLAARAKARAKAYNGGQVISEEETRENTHEAAAAKYRKLLIDGPVLILPLIHKNYTFDPNETFPMESAGMVFPTSQISDDWGTVVVTGGVLLNSTYDEAFVPAPRLENLLEGPGWKLTLNPGWKIIPGTRRGDLKIVQGG